MRISTLQFFQQNLQTFNTSEARLLELQQQVASGISVDQASDNPEAFITALRAQDTITQAEQYNRNIALTRVRFSQQEDALGSANDVLNAVRDSALQARSGTASQFDRTILAQEIRARKDELTSLLNTRDIDGLYVFGSGDQKTAPFTNAGATLNTAGGSAINVEITFGRTVSTGFDPGSAFTSPDTLLYAGTNQNVTVGPDGRYAGSIVDLMESLAIAIERGDTPEMERLTSALEKSNDKLLSARVAAGTKSRQLDDAENNNLNQILQASKIKEDSVGADLSETITQLTQTDAQLRALQVTYSQITKNSLFDLI